MGRWARAKEVDQRLTEFADSCPPSWRWRVRCSMTSHHGRGWQDARAHVVGKRVDAGFEGGERPLRRCSRTSMNA